MPRRKEMLRQLERDIRDHIEQETQDNIDRGMAPEEARYAAIRKFGNVQQVKEQTREVWTFIAIEQLWQDIRYGCRMLRRNPGFAAVAILTLALGIGVNTAVFSVVNTVLLRPLPYPDADRIVAFSNGITASSSEHFKPDIAGADFAEWRAHATCFEKIAGYTYADATVATTGTAGQVRVVSIAGDFWVITGARAVLGRLFEAGKSHDSAVLSYSLFKRQFRGDSRTIGKVVTIDGKPMTVAGILPQEFRFLFPQGWWGLTTTEAGAFVSAPPLLRSKPSRLFVVARLKPLTSVTSALRELQGIQKTILKSYPDRWFPGISRMALLPLQTQLVGSNRRGLLILQVAGLFVLLIACANIANLLLARGAARSHEMAIRRAIGAGATRILRQFLAEGIVLALLGGAAGLLLAKWVITMLVHFGPNAIPRLSETSIDGQVLAFTFGLCLGSGILFGFGPALALWKADVQNTLKRGARNSSIGSGSLRVRQFLVASELALAIILLTGAGLMVKSFWKMYTNPSGFAPENTLIMKVALSGPQYADRARKITYFRELLHRLESMPGARAFGIANREGYLLQSTNSSVLPVVDQFQESLVSPGYFDAIGMRLVKGRRFNGTDPPDATIINETMVRRVFGEKDPLDQRIDHLGRPVHVIGVVANLRYSKLDAEPGPEIFRAYSPNLSDGNITMTVAVRMLGDPLGIAPTLRKSIAGID
ncbi:MAG: ABC transporter permease, partial [Acidobacteriota bacterium]|nr:ABC transporter permease [Acidobacteriota bacterium]